MKKSILFNLKKLNAFQAHIQIFQSRLKHFQMKFIFENTFNSRFILKIDENGFLQVS